MCPRYEGKPTSPEHRADSCGLSCGLSCGRLCVVNTPAGRDSEASRDSTPLSSSASDTRQAARQSPAKAPRRPQCTGIVPHQIIFTQAACPHKIRQPLRAPAQLISSAGGKMPIEIDHCRGPHTQPSVVADCSPDARRREAALCPLERMQAFEVSARSRADTSGRAESPCRPSAQRRRSGQDKIWRGSP